MENQIVLDIATPKGVFHGEFPKTTKVAEVITTVVQALDLDGADSLDLIHNGETLQPTERTLVSFGLEGTVQLELVATGSGV